MIMKPAAFLALMVSVATAQTDGTSAPIDRPASLAIGVRSDAPPFSYKPNDTLLPPGSSSGQLASHGYAGYMVYICDRVLEKMEERGRADGLNIRTVEITAQDRFEKLQATDGKGTIDILCDPATVTRDRVRDFSASLPLYMSGIGFAAQPRDKIKQSECPPPVGLVKSTTAFDQGLMRILDGNEWTKYRADLLKYMHNPTGWLADHSAGKSGRCVAAEGDQPKEPVKDFATHKQVAEAFCNGDLQYYVGDLEIVNRALKLFGTCDFRPAVITFSDDRYVIFMRNPDRSDPAKAQLLMRFSHTLSELVLTQPSLLEEAFKANFEGYQPSDKLRLFFWSLYGP